MASIEGRTRQDGTPSWRVTWREAGVKRSETFTTERDAKRFRGMVDAAGQRYPAGWIPGQGLDAIGSGVTVREWCERAIAARTGITPGTRSRYTALVERHVLPVMGSWPLDAVTRERAALWLNTLIATPLTVSGEPDPAGRTLSAKTIRNVHGLVSSIWSDAITEELVVANPFARLRLPEPSPDAGDMVFLTREEFGILHDLAPAEYRLLLRTLVESGLRFGEATALEVRHLTAEGIAVRQAWKATGDGSLALGPPKTRAGRRDVPIPDDLADDLAAHVAGRAAGDYVFTTPRGFVVRNGTFHSRVWIPLMAQVEPIIGKRPRVHDLRHSHISWLIHEGIDMYRIQAQAGHESIKTTVDRYGHLFKRDDADIKAAASSRTGGSNVKPLRTRRTADR